MAITKPKPRIEPAPNAEDTFIGGAPDAPRQQPTGRGIKKGRKEQVTITIAPSVLDRVDDRAARMGLSRAAWINVCINQGLESGFGGIKGERDE
ncbi:CopG domain protein DNA-binding domain protein [Pseudomonas syringae pv. actinidiae ICMP 19099]|uniref:hypothetical protein n=1 Tax=Pseudomonas syringae TaxID=317 RepID=UPI0003574369|nr:hypothetical protein [Pseudomonas syringae]EPN22711.1 CopG domain protein DNA-binding domain protein [Pseudomonas syringae pv. actinidiae ICMP 19099]